MSVNQYANFPAGLRAMYIGRCLALRNKVRGCWFYCQQPLAYIKSLAFTEPLVFINSLSLLFVNGLGRPSLKETQHFLLVVALSLFQKT